jgi:hypothetical protein
VNDTVPCEASVVDNDVKLAIAELSSLLDEFWNVRVVQQITSDGECLTTGCID